MQKRSNFGRKQEWEPSRVHLAKAWGPPHTLSKQENARVGDTWEAQTNHPFSFSFSVHLQPLKRKVACL